MVCGIDSELKAPASYVTRDGSLQRVRVPRDKSRTAVTRTMANRHLTRTFNDRVPRFFFTFNYVCIEQSR